MARIVVMDLSEYTPDLISQCLQGDAEAFDQIYKQNARAVMVYFLRSGFVQAQAEDLTQETFLRVSQSLGTYDSSRGSFRTWLWSIARNVARRQWSRRRGNAELDLELADEAIAETRDGLIDALASTEESDAVGACVKVLRGELANLVRLRYVEGLTTRGVAQAANIPEATARARLEEALRLLEKCLRSKGFLSP